MLLSRLAAENRDPAAFPMTRAIIAALSSLLLLACGHSLAQRAVRERAAIIQDLLATADRVELLSLEPGEGIPSPDGEFHGFAVIGTTPVESSGQRQDIARQVSQAIANSPPRLAACFLPRHGLRVWRGGVPTDLVICFECATVYIEWRDGRERLNIEETAQPLLDSILDGAGIRRSTLRGGT